MLQKDYFYILMKFSELKRILKLHDLRVTDCRLDILELFIGVQRALTIKDLEEHFHEYDRVTLYRNLAIFTENGVLHKIPNDSGMITYGLCYDTCSSEGHHHNHLHFKCDECGSIECLDVSVPHISIPGYQINEANLILTGMCKSCGQIS